MYLLGSQYFTTRLLSFNELFLHYWTCPLTLWLRYLSFIVLLSKLFGYHCHFFLVLWMLLSLLFQVNSVLIQRRQWHLIPVLLRRKFHGRRSRVDCILWGRRESWVTSLSLFTFMHWRRRWQPTPLFLPGESEGWGSLVGCRLWGRTESDTTEVT